MEAKIFFRYKWVNASWCLNYAVYRHYDDTLEKCGIDRMVETHCVATFVTEAEAHDYCAYRNEMMERYKTDDVSAIVR